MFDTLKAGSRTATDQFAYRYNSDNRSIVAELTHIQNNVHFFTIATATPETYGFLRPMPFSAFVRPSELLKKKYAETTTGNFHAHAQTRPLSKSDIAATPLKVST